MKNIRKKIFLFFCLSIIYTISSAQDAIIGEHIDTIINLDAVWVYPRETQKLQLQPVSYSVVQPKDFASRQISHLNDLTAFVPNFYMPEYGSKITSSIFVRGIGARMNEPSVGLYIDNVPLLSKSSFDFSFADLKNIEILRGPQGTLYGRNSIGGIIRINTISPLEYQGLKAEISNGNYNNMKARFSLYQKLTDKVAFSIGGFYNSNGGYYKNVFRNEKNDEQDFGGRMRWQFKISETWLADWSLSYENTRQNAYPYAKYDAEHDTEDAIAYDAPGTYDRDMLTTGLSFQHKTSKTIFTSTTGFQYLDDKMCMDQDFTTDSILKMTQNQRQNSLTQEFTFRSNDNRPYQHVCGVMGFLQKNEVNAPTTFYASAFRKLVPNLPPFIHIDNDIDIPGKFNTMNIGAAIYHESSYTFFEKLTLTLGLRLDYECDNIDYETSSILNVTANMDKIPMPISVQKKYLLSGDDSNHYFEVLPKFSFKYEFDKTNMLYASIAKGYKAGGYNYTMFSNTMQDAMKNAQKTMNIPLEVLDAGNTVSYKPEYTWNYEIGWHSDLFDNHLSADASAYFIRFNDQQIITYVENGSRMVSNAARSENAGVELSLTAKPQKDLHLNVSYGYLHAIFKKYETAKGDYCGNHLPFAPGHTVSASAEYVININKPLIDRVLISAQYNGAGQIYFSESNDVKQKYYGTLNGRISIQKNYISISCWAKNITDAHYYTFYCESMGNRFVQCGNPFQIGGTISVNL